jgi:hypothetical protein
MKRKQHIRAEFDDDVDNDDGRARGIGSLRGLPASAHRPGSNARQPSHTRIAKATATLIEAILGLILHCRSPTRLEAGRTESAMNLVKAIIF